MSYIILLLTILFLPKNLLANEYVIKAKGIINVQSGSIDFNKFIYIKDNKIYQIQDKLINKYKLIDLSDSYILPGLINCHAHIFTTLTSSDKSFPAAMERESKLPDAFRVKRAKKFLSEYLHEGFTTICDLGNSGHFLDASLKQEIKNDNNYPRLYISGPALASGNAQFPQGTPVDLVQKEYTLVDKNTDMNRLIQDYQNHEVDIIKIILDGYSKTDDFDGKKLFELLRSSRIKYFKKVTSHATSPYAYELIKKYGIENAEHLSSFSDDNNHLKFITNTVIGTDTLKKFNYYNPVLELSQKRLIKYITSRKLKAVFGPDYYFDSDSKDFNRAKEVKSCIDPLKNFGMNNLEIIQAMTINPALSMNIENKIGEVKPGAFADLIAVQENPLLNISTLKKVNFVMENGEIVILK